MFVGVPQKLYGKPKFNLFNQDEKRWCERHPVAFWGKDGLGSWYKRCVQGYKLGEKCKVGE